MPIFEYKCKECGNRFEVLVRGKERVSCPECSSRKLSKLFSTFGVKSGGKFMPSGGSSCDTCNATTCASCKG
ncbi:MAG: zinc ribbon domain-containing protein [Actinobacteria bacterium]|nr:zinc ribbon domain-containing protein [Actinomycetota bacterium]